MESCMDRFAWHMLASQNYIVGCSLRPGMIVLAVRLICACFRCYTSEVLRNVHAYFTMTQLPGI